MRQGLKGYGCCSPFHVWGISVEAPMVTSFSQSGAQSVDISPGTRPAHFYYPESNGIRGGIGLEGINDVGEGPPNWSVFAAKVPAYYPYRSCDLWPPISSADPRLGSGEQWKVELGISIERREFNDGSPHTANPPGFPQFEFVRRAIHSSRVIYEDGEQKYVVYVQTPNWNRPTHLIDLTGGGYESGYPIDWKTDERGGAFGQHIQVGIDTQTAIASYNVDYLDGIVGVDDFTETTAMRQAWVWDRFKTSTTRFLIPAHVSSLGSGGGGYFTSAHGEYVCHDHCFGKEYYSVSTYKPATSRYETFPDDLEEWSVGRLKYEGYEVFCSGLTHLTGKDHNGDYALLIPAIRADLRTAVEVPKPDEPWWIARSYSDGIWKLVVGRWLNEDLRSGTGDMETGYADGTLQEAEVEEIIYEGDAQPEVYAYNRMRGKNLVAFALLGDVTEYNVYEPLADFEPLEYEIEGNIDSGLPDGVFFTTKGEFGGGWFPRNDVYFTNPPDYNVIDFTKWAAKAESSPSFLGLVVLDIEINVVNDNSNISFMWRLDNRATAAEFPHALLNQVATDGMGGIDKIQFLIDNVVVFENDGTTFDVGDPEDWSVYHLFDLATDNPSYLMISGKHKLRWVFRRYTTANNDFPTFAAIDDVQFPEITTADPEGVPWYYDGTEARVVKHRIRPARDDTSTLTTPTTIIPHSIAIDREDRIWYGNPHGIIKLAENNIDKDVEVKFTVVPGEKAPSESVPVECREDRCDVDECDSIPPEIEAVQDPPWGVFQILPTKKFIQVRGANASIKDASTLPINFDHDLEGRWRFSLFPATGIGNWNRRAHAWNISSDGKVRLPHIEVVFRYNLNLESYPFKEPFPNPPYAANILDPATTFPVGWRFHFLRHIKDVENGSLDNRMDDHNFLVSRCYSDAQSRQPQYRWLYNPNPDPVEGDDDYTDWILLNLAEPYPTKKAIIWPIYYPGTGSRKLDSQTMNPSVNYHGNVGCVKYIDEFEVEQEGEALTVGPNVWLGPSPDFDAVDCECNCCEDAGAENKLPFKGRQQGFDPDPPPGI